MVYDSVDRITKVEINNENVSQTLFMINEVKKFQQNGKKLPDFTDRRDIGLCHFIFY